MKHLLAPLALLAARATVPASEAGDSPQGCAGDGLYLISIRGSTELPGIGVSGTLLGTQVKDQIKGTKIVALDYPASLSDPLYADSVVNGTKALTKLISQHVKSCPKDKIAIMGYSQGAQVAMDTVCGSDDSGFDKTAPIASDKVENHVVAIAVFGDPTYVANVTYNKGTSKTNGIFFRKNTNSCLKYANIISSWCDTGDIYCARGNSSEIHSEYFGKYGSDIVKFIVDKARRKSSSGGGGGGTSSASPTDTTTATIPGETAASTASAPTATSTTTPTTTATSTSAAAHGLTKGSKSLYVALPLVLAAMFQVL
ncbi:hypothetical protein E4U43_004748 [Claviceps pusilla]|uniref:Acetylxylan esterase n=1 Tax=Claviceps pusilla TaxID=123648 RepID=A0A9P7SUI0_9HYPO|nr:hypothetical protein E4U43_004748 [Claviceps pusilla]